MKVLAIAEKGREYLYNARTAHKVASAHAQAVCDALNGAGYALDDSTVWTVVDVNAYDNAYYYAETQKFTYGKRGIVRKMT